jgi:hypothetical protein
MTPTSLFQLPRLCLFFVPPDLLVHRAEVCNTTFGQLSMCGNCMGGTKLPSGICARCSEKGTPFGCLACLGMPAITNRDRSLLPMQPMRSRARCLLATPEASYFPLGHRPTFEVSGPTRQDTSAARCNMAFSASRRRCPAVAGPLDRGERQRVCLVTACSTSQESCPTAATLSHLALSRRTSAL